MECMVYGGNIKFCVIYLTLFSNLFEIRGNVDKNLEKTIFLL